MYLTGTICAPATIPGTGAITVIRISGPDALRIADTVVTLRHGTLSQSKGYTAHFGYINDDGHLLDEVVAVCFRAPSSYTGEDSVEISCHASEYIARRILDLLCRAGARLAEPGEFTRRAFLSGKMDLAQAEAVADVIAASSEAAHHVAMSQLKGTYSDRLRELRKELLHLTALMELELDFSEEEVEFADRRQLLALVSDAIDHTRKLADSFREGNAIRNGVPVAIAGPANSGKSTLLNALVGEDRAIVSDIAGTTRDTIEETMVLDGILYRFIDTAGIRDTADSVEQIGIDRALQKLEEADIVLAVTDASKPSQEDTRTLKLIEDRLRAGQTLILVRNKIDLTAEGQPDDILHNCPSQSGSLHGDSPSVPSAETPADDASKTVMETVSVRASGAGLTTVNISAKTGQGLEYLKQQISETRKARTKASEILVTNERHHQALRNACTALMQVRQGLNSNLPGDLVSQDLREAIDHLGTITGEISTDEVLGIIFGSFCIGK